MLINRFIREFTSEHCRIQDLLFDLITCIITIKRRDALEKLNDLSAIAGVHFRYEEEMLYPILKRFYGESYINKLYTDHDLAIGRAFKIAEILDTGFDEEAERLKAINHVRGLLPRVSDCQGLTLFAEEFSDNEMKEVIHAMETARKDNYDLHTWVTTIRNRKILKFQ